MKKLYLHGNKKHPFLFNLLRLSGGNLMHVNSIFKNYNDNHENKEEIENRLQKYIVCNSIQEMEERLKTITVKNNQTLYIIAKFQGGYNEEKQMSKMHTRMVSEDANS